MTFYVSVKVQSTVHLCLTILWQRYSIRLYCNLIVGFASSIYGYSDIQGG